MSKVKLLLIAVIIFIVVAVVFYLYLSLKKSPTELNPSKSQPAAGTNTLGGSIYAQSQNPIQGKVPALNPVSNPVQGLYKNPFE